ncbi:MAG: sigma-E factor negative regulatory protein [Steroidobacteraceae bacterium]
MNEQEQTSQLSALFDGELPPQQTQMVIRRALKDPALRASWERYALIGACLRGDPLASSVRGSVSDRVRARLVAEAELGGNAAAPAPGAGAAGSTRRFLSSRSMLGGAIAAGVALMAVVLVRSLPQVAVDPGTLVAQDAATPAVGFAQQAADAGPRSYTTPGENSPAARRIDQPLAHYLVAHSEVAASTFGYSSDLTQGAVEMTEAEIRAHR